MALQNSDSDPDGSWPPPVESVAVERRSFPAPSQIRIGRLAVWSVVLGFVAWPAYFLIAWLLTLTKASGSVSDIAFRGCYFLGLGLEIAAITLGRRAWTVRTGRVSYGFGIAILVAMVGITLWDHISSGSGQWMWNETGSDGDCGCDDSG